MHVFSRLLTVWLPAFLLCLSNSFAQTKPVKPAPRPVSILKKLPLGELHIPAGAKFEESSLPLNGLMASQFSSIKYYTALDATLGIMAFAYDYQFKKYGTPYELKAGMDALVDQFASNLDLVVAKQQNACDTNWCFYKVFYAEGKDTFQMLIKAHQGNQYISVYAVLADKKNRKLQNDLFTKTRLAASSREIQPASTEELFTSEPDSLPFGVIFRSSDHKFTAREIPLNGLLALMFKRADYYYCLDLKNNLNIFAYDFEFKKPGDEYDLQAGIKGVTEKLGESLSLKKLHDTITGDAYQGLYEGYYMSDTGDTLRFVFSGLREQQYLTIWGIVAPDHIRNRQDDLFQQSRLAGLSRKQEDDR